MPQKGSIVSNVFEQLEDLGKSTVKSTAKAVNQTFNPVKLIEEITAPSGKTDPAAEEKLKEGSGKQSATPLDLKKLDNKYKENSLNDLAAVRRQFNLVKSEEKRALDELEKEEMMRKQKIAQEEAQKNQQKQQQAQQEQIGGLPQGKKKRGVMAPKKKSQEKHAEMKPATGKQ